MFGAELGDAAGKLDRFIDGQRFGYETALAEIKNGRKDNHWIWYVFPQLKGLGHSPNANYYGISGLEEAKQFLAHPVLGSRLREITEVLLAIENKSAEEIFPEIDAVKVRSSMTLFDIVSPHDIFSKVLDKYYGGVKDEMTLSLIKAMRTNWSNIHQG